MTCGILCEFSTSDICGVWRWVLICRIIFVCSHHRWLMNWNLVGLMVMLWPFSRVNVLEHPSNHHTAKATGPGGKPRHPSPRWTPSSSWGFNGIPRPERTHSPIVSSGSAPGSLLVGQCRKASRGRCSGGIFIRCLNQFLVKWRL